MVERVWKVWEFWEVCEEITKQIHLHHYYAGLPTSETNRKEIMFLKFWYKEKENVR
ncbi:MAG: hypothetical protein F6K18_10455 [Okeania sp. SIO2C2]|uniref:hypothetical protein n=1 Tax=Okeania sp. SIO2C2 TaxID=2607787 RepID=UPI0013BE695C|nr:hypothetical protein [Okeania sp. SIO2C2]NEP87214.1 hypothetical protein [Okeania sp. SIO2C2]